MKKGRKPEYPEKSPDDELQCLPDSDIQRTIAIPA